MSIESNFENVTAGAPIADTTSQTLLAASMGDFPTRHHHPRPNPEPPHPVPGPLQCPPGYYSVIKEFPRPPHRECVKL